MEKNLTLLLINFTTPAFLWLPPQEGSRGKQVHHYSLTPSLPRSGEQGAHLLAKTFVKEQKFVPSLLSASQEARGQIYFAVGRICRSNLTQT
jgi:hypothetical protein